MATSGVSKSNDVIIVLFSGENGTTIRQSTTSQLTVQQRANGNRYRSKPKENTSHEESVSCKCGKIFHNGAFCTVFDKNIFAFLTEMKQQIRNWALRDLIERALGDLIYKTPRGRFSSGTKNKFVTVCTQKQGTDDINLNRARNQSRSSLSSQMQTASPMLYRIPCYGYVCKLGPAVKRPNYFLIRSATNNKLLKTLFNEIRLTLTCG